MDELIRKQDALDAIHCDIIVTGRQNAELVAATIGVFADRIKALPTVQPNTGYWGDYLPDGLRWKCSECGSIFETPYNFCPHCGTRMEG